MADKQPDLTPIIERVNTGRIRPDDAPLLLEALALLQAKHQQDANLREALEAWAVVQRAADAWGEDIVI